MPPVHDCKDCRAWALYNILCKPCISASLSLALFNTKINIIITSMTTSLTRSIACYRSLDNTFKSSNSHTMMQ